MRKERVYQKLLPIQQLCLKKSCPLPIFHRMSYSAIRQPPFKRFHVSESWILVLTCIGIKPPQYLVFMNRARRLLEI